MRCLPSACTLVALCSGGRTSFRWDVCLRAPGKRALSLSPSLSRALALSLVASEVQSARALILCPDRVTPSASVGTGGVDCKAACYLLQEGDPPALTLSRLE